MNESISRAAGTQHGQEFPPAEMERLISGLGRVPKQRTTLYDDADAVLRDRSFRCAPLQNPVFTPFQRKRAHA